MRALVGLFVLSMSASACATSGRDTFVEVAHASRLAASPTAVPCASLSAARRIGYGATRLDQQAEGTAYRAYLFEGAVGDEIEIRVTNAGRVGERPVVLVLGPPSDRDTFPVLRADEARSSNDAVVKTRLDGETATFAVGGASAFRVTVTRSGA